MIYIMMMSLWSSELCHWTLHQRNTDSNMIYCTFALSHAIATSIPLHCIPATELFNFSTENYSENTFVSYFFSCHLFLLCVSYICVYILLIIPTLLL